MSRAGAEPVAVRRLRPRLAWLAALGVGLALLAVSFAGALARVNEQRAGIEGFLRDRTGLEVRFAALKIQLGFYGPEATFSDVSFRRPGAHVDLLHAASVTARFEYLRLLREAQLQPGLITLRDSSIDLDAAGVEPAAASATIVAAESAQSAVYSLAVLERRLLDRLARVASVLPEARLRFEGVAAQLSRSPGAADRWLLQSPLIVLDKSAQDLRVAGTLRLPERLGQSLWFRIAASADARDHGRLELRVRDLTLAPWREVAAIAASVDGSLDLHIDANWRQARLQTADANVLWHTAGTPTRAHLQFDRDQAALTADAPRMPLAALRQLWQAFDPAAQALGQLGDVEAQGEVTDLHLLWTPHAALGQRARFSASLPRLQLFSQRQNLQLTPLQAVLSADERNVNIELTADQAELRGIHDAAGEGRPVSLAASLHAGPQGTWQFNLNSAVLGARRIDNPDAADRALPALTNLRAALHWHDSGERWSGELSGATDTQPFRASWRGDAVHAQLQAASAEHWRAALLLSRSDGRGWRPNGGHIALGRGQRPLRAANTSGILIDGRIATLDLLDLAPALGRWPRGAMLPDWRGAVQVGQLRLAGQPLGPARLGVARTDSVATVQLSSAQLAGQWRLQAGGGWNADLQRLHLRDDGRDASLLARLAALQQPLKLAVADLRLGSRQFGRLNLQVLPSDGDLLLQRLTLSRSGTTLRGNGRCRAASGQCSLQLALAGDDLAGWLQALGQGPALDGDHLRGDLQLDWPMHSGAAWVASVTGHASLSATAVSLADAAVAPWAAGLAAAPALRPSAKLAAQLSWSSGKLQFDSLALRDAQNELQLSGQLDYQTRRIDEQLNWRPVARIAALSAPLAALQDATLHRLPALASAVGGVERWVSGEATARRWQVTGSIDAPHVTALVAE